MAIMIRTEHLRKVYRVGDERVVALADINLEIQQGEIVCIVGASGSGKSTMLNMLAGLEKPTKGIVAINGKKINAMDENQLAKFRQENLGFIFQSYNLLPQLTAIENVSMPLMFTGMNKKDREKRALHELKQMGLERRADHQPTEMSGGQQQRVGIARAFVSKPKVIFADEPTGNLDSRTTRLVLRTMLERAEKYNITFVMVTHEMDLSECGDRIVTLKDGKVIDNRVLTEEEKQANRAKMFEGLDDAAPDEPDTTEPIPGKKKPQAAEGTYNLSKSEDTKNA